LLIGILFLPLVASGSAQIDLSPVDLAYPVLYLDLDGTALDGTNEVLQATVKALNAFEACGGEVGLATGRILEQARDAIETLAPTLPVVLFNGAVLYDPTTQELTVENSLPQGSAQRVIGILEGLEKPPGLIFHFARQSVTPSRTARLEDFADEYDISLMEEPLSSLDVGPTAYAGDPIVKILIVCETDERETIRQMLHHKLSHDERAVISSKYTVEVLPAQANKASAIRRAIAERGYEMQQVVAFGDSGNDVEMLSEVGLGIAMANCYPQTCEVADLIIGPNNSSAIAKCIYTLLIPERCLNER
jgi:Cof subfamily protein (haloacid dehalogenase superfamily)